MNHTAQGIRTDVTDARTPEERILIQNNGGVLILLHRPDKALAGQAALHHTEQSLGTPQSYHAVIKNDGTLEDLETKVKKTMRRICETQPRCQPQAH